MSVKNANIKQYYQNIFDFVLTNYGNLEYLNTFLEQNPMNMIDFPYKTGLKFNIIAEPTFNLSEYERMNHIVATDKSPITNGDFNSDFNIDYLI